MISTFSYCKQQQQQVLFNYIGILGTLLFGNEVSQCCGSPSHIPTTVHNLSTQNTSHIVAAVTSRYVVDERLGLLRSVVVVLSGGCTLRYLQAVLVWRQTAATASQHQMQMALQQPFRTFHLPLCSSPTNVRDNDYDDDDGLGVAKI